MQHSTSRSRLVLLLALLALTVCPGCVTATVWEGYEFAQTRYVDISEEGDEISPFLVETTRYNVPEGAWRVLVTPFNLGIRRAPELDGTTAPVASELIDALQDSGAEVQVLSHKAALELWQQAFEAGERGA